MDEPRGLSCSVCYNPFKATESQAIPRNLNCGHTYCTACLGKLSSQSQYAFVRCPACKHETLLLSRFNGISSLPKNFGVLEIIEGKETLDKKSVGAAIDQERAKNKYQCDEHNEPKKVYCYTDQTLICIYCQIYGKHQGHRCELASKLAINVREELCKLSKKLGDEHKKICQAKQSVVTRKEAIQQQQQNLKQRVVNHISAMKGVLGRREMELKIMVDDLTNPKLRVIEAQERSLTEVIDKCEELYILMHKVQEDGDSGIVEAKATIESLISEITSLSEKCELKPQAIDNLLFHTEIDGIYMIHSSVGEVREANDEQGQTEQDATDALTSEAESLLATVLANLGQVMNDAENNSSRGMSSAESDDAAEVVVEVEEQSSAESEEETSSEESSTEEGEEEEARAEEEEQQSALVVEVDEDALASDGELVGAVGGAPSSAAIQTVETKRKNDSKQGLLRELQVEIERLKLMGPRGDLIRVLDDTSSSSEEEEESDNSSENEAPSLQLDFKIRVNNDVSRNRSSRASTSTATPQGLGTSSNNEQTSRDRQTSSHQILRAPRMRCSVSNCQYHVNAVLQCKNCKRVFCRQCAPASVLCNRSQNGHSFVKYKSQNKTSRNFNNRRPDQHSGAKSKKNSLKNDPRGEASCVSSPPWQCQRCTMLNEGNVLVCGMCMTFKDFDPSSVRNVCPMCTLVNEPGKTCCELCKTPLQSQEDNQNSSHLPD